MFQCWINDVECLVTCSQTFLHVSFGEILKVFKSCDVKIYIVVHLYDVVSSLQDQNTDKWNEV